LQLFKVGEGRELRREDGGGELTMSGYPELSQFLLYNEYMLIKMGNTPSKKQLSS
jgi:hypothetical protein